MQALRKHGLVRGQRSWPAGGCCAATRGATEASTRSDESDLRRPLVDPADAARARDAARPRLVPLDLGLSWAWSIVATTVVVRMLLVPLTSGRSTRCRACSARAADEGDPEEVQARQAEAERGADEVLPGEQHQPGRLVPADARCRSRSSSRSTTRCRHFNASIHRAVAQRRTSRSCTSSRRSRGHTTTHWGGYVLLVVYVASQMASTLLHVGDRGQDAARCCS